jgi:hypothetical protein
MATLGAILQALPKILALFQLITGMVRDREQRGVGRKEAIAEALELAGEDLRAGNAAREQARARHQADPTDGAFDSDFRRGA